MCESYGGAGVVQNPKFEEAKWKYPKTDYYLSFERTLKCKNCKGAGYVIENISDVLHSLKTILNIDRLIDAEKQELQNCIKAIEGNEKEAKN